MGVQVKTFGTTFIASSTQHELQTAMKKVDAEVNEFLRGHGNHKTLNDFKIQPILTTGDGGISCYIVSITYFI